MRKYIICARACARIITCALCTDNPSRLVCGMQVGWGGGGVAEVEEAREGRGDGGQCGRYNTTLEEDEEERERMREQMTRASIVWVAMQSDTASGLQDPFFTKILLPPPPPAPSSRSRLPPNPDPDSDAKWNRGIRQTGSLRAHQQRTRPQQ